MSKTTKQPTAKDVLGLALKYIRKGWTQGYFARNEVNGTVHEASLRACKWCSVGAVYRACADLNASAIQGDDAKDALRRQVRRSNLVTWNDAKCRTHEQVIDAFERAIAHA